MDRYFKAQDVVNGYSILDFIGEGRYGIVYLAENEKGEKCVIKQLKKKTLKQPREKLFYEQQILKQLNNPCFPRFISAFKDEYREGYIMEYIDGKVFEDIIAADGHVFSREEIYDTARQLLHMVEILHSSNIVHRDIRLPNVIKKENNELALIDFGLARFIDNQKYVKEQDYWYIGDFLIHLYYTSYKAVEQKERPWFEELDLTPGEALFLKKLMGIEEPFSSIDEIKEQLEKLA